MKAFENCSEKILGWISIAVQERGMGFPTFCGFEHRGSQGMVLMFGLLDIVIIKFSSDKQFSIIS